MPSVVGGLNKKCKLAPDNTQQIIYSNKETNVALTMLLALLQFS